MERFTQSAVLRTFLPAKDFALEKQFYQDLGFNLGYDADDMCVFQAGLVSFYLQKYYVKDWAENFMMFLEVTDVDKVYEHLISLDLNLRYQGIRIAEPADEFWGRVRRIITPSGVLWHFETFAQAD
jgi:predicted lactoylglutathione lyase